MGVEQYHFPLFFGKCRGENIACYGTLPAMKL
jgi:hypothetical protein